MSKKADPKLIGIFVLGAVTLIVAAVLIFGSGKFFKERNKFVMFYDGSVKGLDVGAPVILKGVKVGSVIDVSVVFNSEMLNFINEVLAEVEPDRISVIGSDTVLGQMFEEAEVPERLEILIGRGLRAQLQLQSFVTGKLLVALELRPGTEVHLTRLSQDYPEVPTIPTEIETLTAQLKNLKLKEMVADLRKASAGLDRLINSPELAESIESLNRTLKDFGKLVRTVGNQVDPLASSIKKTLGDTRQLVKNVDSQVEPVASNLNDTLETARVALVQAKKTLASYEGVLAEESALNYQITEALEQVSTAARSIAVLTDYLERHPSSVLRGKSNLRR